MRLRHTIAFCTMCGRAPWTPTTSLPGGEALLLFRRTTCRLRACMACCWQDRSHSCIPISAQAWWEAPAHLSEMRSAWLCSRNFNAVSYPRWSINSILFNGSDLPKTLSAKDDEVKALASMT